MTRILLAAVVTATGIVATLAGCGSTPKTERLQGDDIQFTATEAAAKLMAAPFVADRSASAPKASVATRRAEVIARLQLTEAERWYMVDKVAAALPVQALRDRNMAFVIPEEKARALAARDPSAAFPPDRKPTHVLSASIRAANRSEQAEHSAYYMVEYKITSLDGGEVVWSDTVEFKREARGRTYD